MDAPDSPFSALPGQDAPSSSLTKREYFAVHLFGPVTANLSQYCTMQDRAQHAVDAADALIRALQEKAPGEGGVPPVESSP